MQDLNKQPVQKTDKGELIKTALDSGLECIDAITEGIRTTCSLYQAGEDTEASQKFSEVIELIDLFVQLVAQIQRTQRSRGTPFAKNEEMQNLEMHLLGVLKALIPAKEKGDIVMLCDLLEYELIDNLTQWKITAIPNMKGLQEPKGTGGQRP